MPTISTITELRSSIRELEARSFQQEQELKDAATEAFERLNPLNILKRTLTSAVTAPGFGKSLIKNVFGLAVGVLSKKIFFRKSSNIFNRALGTVVEIGVAKAVADNAEYIQSGGKQLLKRVMR